MTETARLPAERTILHGKIAGVRPPRWRQPPDWAWGLSLVAQVACAALATGYTFFFVDDFLFLGQARNQGLSLAYLREQLFEHFSPISRLLDKLLVVLSPGSFVLAHGVELALYAAALLAFAFVVRTILGNSWAAFALTVAFGQSIFLMRLLNWWTATANILPSTIFMLLALGCYLRWLETRSRSLLAASFAAFALSLLDYEDAFLFPAYLAIIRLFVLEPRMDPRRWLGALWREWAAWAGYLALLSAALVNFYVNVYYPSPGHASLHPLLDYLVLALVDTFVPALVGIKYPVAPSSHPLAIAAAVAVVAAAIAVTMYLRPRAWRCVVAFVVVFLVTMVPLGLTRVGEFGTSIGHVIYYQQSLQFMFLVLAAFAISARWSGRRAPSRTGGPAAVRAARWRGDGPWQPSRRLLGAAGALAVAIYAVLYVTSLRAMSAASWQPRQDSAYVSTYLASLRRVRAASGREPMLVDLTVPHKVMPKHLWPYTTYGQFFALFDPNLHVNGIVNPAYIITAPGRLVPVRFVASAGGLIDRSVVSATPGGAPAPGPRAGGGCVFAGTGQRWLSIPLGRTVNAGANGPDAVIQVRFRSRVKQWVAVAVIAPTGLVSHQRAKQVWDPGRGGELIAVDGGRQTALGVAGPIAAVAFGMSSRACVTGLSVGGLQSP